MSTINFPRSICHISQQSCPGNIDIGKNACAFCHISQQSQLGTWCPLFAGNYQYFPSAGNLGENRSSSHICQQSIFPCLNCHISQQSRLGTCRPGPARGHLGENCLHVLTFVNKSIFPDIKCRISQQSPSTRKPYTGKIGCTRVTFVNNRFPPET